MWINAIVLYLIYFPGNLAVGWPYKVGFDRSKGLTLFGAYKRVFIPMSEIQSIEPSYFWQGIRFSKTSGFLGQCVIHFLFGSERRELAQTIKSAIEERDAATPPIT